MLVFATDSEMFVSLTSRPLPNRKLEAQSVALAKQMCAKPVAAKAWRLAMSPTIGTNW